MSLSDTLLGIGLVLTLGVGILLVGSYLRAPRRTAYPAYGWAGLIVIVTAEALLFWDVWPVSGPFHAAGLERLHRGG